MREKKVVLFIVEGPSDEAALGSVMKEYFSSDEVQFVVVHGDITLKDNVSLDDIKKKINEQIEYIQRRYRYNFDDFIRIIHIVDMDGVYIPSEDIKNADIEEVQYYEDFILAKHVQVIADRNKRKGDILFKLRKTGKIHEIPYRIYFNSCNLEHVLYGELKNYSDEEKQRLSDEFADKYDGRAEEFVTFISEPAIAVLVNYQKKCDYIEKDKNSLLRHSNMHFIFKNR